MNFFDYRPKGVKPFSFLSKKTRLSLIKRFLKERTEVMLDRDLNWPVGSLGYDRRNVRVEILSFKITALESF